MAPVPQRVIEQARHTAAAMLIAEAGRTFGASLDLAETLRNIGHLVVGWFADWCIVDLLREEDGTLSRVQVAAADPRQAELARSLMRFPPDLKRPSLIRQTLHSRRPAVIEQLTPEHLAACAQGEMHLALLVEMGLTSCAVVPLIAGDRLMGTLLIGVRSGSIGPRDEHTAEEIARIAAMAIHNSRVHEQASAALGKRDHRLAIVAHDLRAPLSTAVFAAGLLRLRLEEAGMEDVDGVFDVLSRSTEQMVRLIEDLTDVAGLQRGRLSVSAAPVRTADLLAEVVEAYAGHAAELGITLETNARPGSELVQADRARLLQVFSNLLGNAIRFTPRGGTIRIAAARDDGFVRFSVVDSGSGIPAQVLDRIFEPFWQGDGQAGRGLGLGLSITRAIVDAHRGSIRVQSQPGVGTEVHFSIPAVAG
jgi:signal transduction histidine kinase